MDPEVLRLNGNKEYLLQVWTRKGEMIFEKPLAKPVHNWNISDNKFTFHETKNSPDIYVVRLCNDNAIHKKRKEYEDGNESQEQLEASKKNVAPVVFKFSNAAFATSHGERLPAEESKT